MTVRLRISGIFWIPIKRKAPEAGGPPRPFRANSPDVTKSRAKLGKRRQALDRNNCPGARGFVVDRKTPPDLVPREIVDDAGLEQPPGGVPKPLASPAERPQRVESFGDVMIGRPAAVRAPGPRQVRCRSGKGHLPQQPVIGR